MLKTPQSASTVPADPSAFTSGQYLIWPGQGLSVIGARQIVNYGEASIEVVKCHLLREPSLTRMVPAGRLGASGFRDPATAAELSSAFERFESSAGTRKARWLAAAEEFKDLLKEGSVPSLVAVLNATLGKHRGPADGHDDPLTKLGHKDISYSERQIALQALDLLSEELAFATGMADRDARRVVSSYALVDGFKAKFTDRPSRPTHLAADQMRALSSNGTGAPPAAVTIVPPPPPKVRLLPVAPTLFGEPAKKQQRFSQASVQTVEKPAAKRKSPVAPRQPATVGLSAEDRAAGQENRLAMVALHKRETSQVSARGLMRGLLTIAAQSLSPEQFGIYVPTVLRFGDTRLSLAEAAKQEGIGIAEAIALRDQSAAIMLEKYAPESERTRRMSCFHPHISEQPAAAVPSPKPPTTLKAPEPAKPAKASPAASAEPDIPSFLKDDVALIPTKVPLGYFRKALAILGDDELDVIVKSKLRRLGHRLSFEEIAELRQVGLPEIIDLFNSGAAKMRAVLPPAATRQSSVHMFNHVDQALKPRAGTVSQDGARHEKPSPASQPELPDYVREEAAHAESRGAMCAYFQTAATLLTRDEFDVLSRTTLRVQHRRLSLAETAERTGRTVKETTRLHDLAAAKMQTTLKKEGEIGANLFRPWLEKQREGLDLDARPVQPRVSLDKLFVAGLPPVNVPIYERERSLVPVKGPTGAAFKKAANTMEPNAFAAVTANRLRFPAQRLDIAATAALIDRDPKTTGSLIDVASRALGLAGRKPEPVAESAAGDGARHGSPSRADRQLVEAEKALAPFKGPIRGFFNLATELPERQFQILSWLYLRSPMHRLSIEGAASVLKQPVEAVIAARNDACEALRERAKPEGRYALMSLFNPYAAGKDGHPQTNRSAGQRRNLRTVTGRNAAP